MNEDIRPDMTEALARIDEAVKELLEMRKKV